MLFFTVLYSFNIFCIRFCPWSRPGKFDGVGIFDIGYFYENGKKQQSNDKITIPSSCAVRMNYDNGLFMVEYLNVSTKSESIKIKQFKVDKSKNYHFVVCLYEVGQSFQVIQS